MDKNFVLEIKKLRKSGLSYGEISRIMGITKSQASYASNFDENAFAKEDEYINKITKLVKECNSINEVCLAAGKKWDRKKVEKIINDNGLDISHFSKKSRNKNTSGNICISHLRERLIKTGLKEHKCENPECGLTEWHGKPIPLQLHHINGDRTDNRLENLQLLCPNCHAQTDNYSGKNKRVKRTVLDNNDSCGKKNEIPNKDVLIDDFKKCGTLKGVSEKYGVTEKTIKEWYRKKELPSSSIELRKLMKELYGDIKWSFSNGANVLNNVRKKFTPIVLVDDDGNIEKKYNSINEIMSDGYSYKLVKRVCNGELKSHKGRIFKSI